MRKDSDIASSINRIIQVEGSTLIWQEDRLFINLKEWCSSSITSKDSEGFIPLLVIQ